MDGFRQVTDDEMGRILKEFCQATQRPMSGNFLDRFPWRSTEWFQARLEEGDFEDLFLYWYGEAWNEPNIRYCRTLHAGVDRFREMQDNHSDYCTDHVRGILKKRDWHAPEETFLILAASSTKGPFMILDGNHRAVALWNAAENSPSASLPSLAWVGISPEMPSYRSFGG